MHFIHEGIPGEHNYKLDCSGSSYTGAFVKASTSAFSGAETPQKAVVCQNNTALGVNILLQTELNHLFPQHHVGFRRD